jgi:hypothetical protein
MTFKKTVAIAAAAGALAAISVPAMALENEFHGMYKLMGYQTNFFNGVAVGLSADPKSGFQAEQRARLQYTAKASADLKLVTHFELDTRFGGKATPTGAITSTSAGYLGTATGNDAGNLDADQLTLETKNIFLDFNCPITGANVKAGLQPWADSYQSLFLLADMTGVQATKKFGAATANLGWFRFDDNTATPAQVGKLTADLLVVDGKFAINKDMTVGASYYNIQNDTGTTAPAYELLHMLGLNADIKVGPANIKPFLAYQFGDRTATTDVKAFMLGAVSKIKVGAGAVNISAIYLSGDDNANKEKSFTTVAANSTYFNAANMWLLIRNGQAVNSSFSVLGNDMTVGGRGLMGIFAGYEATRGKVFYNANLGYAQVANTRTTGGVEEESAIGTEINAQVGYKLFDNLSASAALAYAMLGDGLSSATAAKRFGGAANADDPYALNLQLSYTF